MISPGASWPDMGEQVEKPPISAARSTPPVKSTPTRRCFPTILRAPPVRTRARMVRRRGRAGGERRGHREAHRVRLRGSGGHGGQARVHRHRAVIDFKSQKIKRDAKGTKAAFYETWPLQLEAYRQAILHSGEGRMPAEIERLAIKPIEPSPVE